MAIGKITFKCSVCGQEHETRVKKYNRQQATDWEAWAKENIHICPSCYRAEKDRQGCEEVEMHYGEYKKNFSNCKTKPDSYNRDTKTIIVYVPKEGV